MILLEVMPEEEADVFEVSFIVVIMVADGVEWYIIACQFFVLRDECPPDIQAGDHIFKISRHTHAHLQGIFLFERVCEVGMLQNIVYLVGDACIIEVGRAGLFIRMQLQPVLRENLRVLHIIVLYVFVINKGANVVKILYHTSRTFT